MLAYYCTEGKIKGKHLLKVREEAAKDGKQESGLVCTVRLKDSVHNAFSRRSNLVLVETACEEVVATDDDSLLVLVLAHHDTLDLAAALGVERRTVMEKVDQNGRDDLLACPPAQGLDVRRRYRQNQVIGQAKIGGQPREHQENQLRVLVFCKAAVDLANLDASDDVVLNEATNRTAIRRHDVLQVILHNCSRFSAAELILRKMDVDLVPIEVCIIRFAVGIMHPDHALPLIHAHFVRHQRDLPSVC